MSFWCKIGFHDFEVLKDEESITLLKKNCGVIKDCFYILYEKYFFNNSVRLFNIPKVKVCLRNGCSHIKRDIHPNKLRKMIETERIKKR